MTVALGGPGVACSAMLVRRLQAGELGEEAARRAEAHLAGCARCQAVARELDAERAALAAELPFEVFAAGVAERLAVRAAGDAAGIGGVDGNVGSAGAAAAAAAGSTAPGVPGGTAGLAGASGRARSGVVPTAWRRLAPFALAAALLLGVAVPILSQLGAQGPLAPDDGTRVKGGASAALWLREGDGAQGGSGARALAPGEAIPRGGALRLALAPAGRRFAAAALRDEDGAVLLAAGPATAGPGPAFEWTGTSGELVVVYDDHPVDGAALVARLQRGGPAAGSPGAEVVVLPLVRGRR